jgi:hypothetical protein
MEHQDLRTIIITKKINKPKKINNNFISIKLDDDGIEKIKEYKLSTNEIKEYVKIRNELKISREE